MQIALAIIVSPDHGSVLIRQRPMGVHLAGTWEFPGGKIEPGETAARAAVREALEETMLAVEVMDQWSPVEHAYPNRTVTLHAFLCVPTHYSAAPASWVWVPISELGSYDLPAANQAFVARLMALAQR